MPNKIKLPRINKYFFCLIIALLLNSKAIAGFDCASVATGNWSDPATWNCTGATAIPGSDDTVLINDSNNVTLDIDATVQSIVLDTSAGLTVAPSMDGLTLTTTNGHADLFGSNSNILLLEGDFTVTVEGLNNIFLSQISGEHNITLNTAGFTFFPINIGLFGSPGSITTDSAGSTIIEANTIQTTDSIVFGDPVILVNNTFFISSPAIEFMSTLDSDFTGLNTSFSIETNSFAAFRGDVGSSSPLERFIGSTGTTLIAADMTVSGDQIMFDGPVQIDNNPVITHSGVPILSIRFNDIITEASPAAQSMLTLSTQDSGDVVFFGDVTIDSLIVSEATGSAGIFGDISTTGSQTYNGAVDTATPQLSATFIQFNNTLRINGDVLTVNPQAGGSIAADNIFGDGGLVKNGPGEFLLAASNTYTGTTTINQGSLIIDGSTDIASNVTVDGGVLGGSGAANGPVDINSGVIAPGSSPGILNTGDLFADSSAIYSAELDGLVPGIEHDQINVTGTVSLNNAELELSGSYIPIGLNDVIVLINNDDLDPVTGVFAGLPEGAIINNNGPMTLSYIGGSGNDVVLIDDEGLFADSFESLN